MLTCKYLDIVPCNVLSVENFECLKLKYNIRRSKAKYFQIRFTKLARNSTPAYLQHFRQTLD